MSEGGTILPCRHPSKRDFVPSQHERGGVGGAVRDGAGVCKWQVGVRDRVGWLLGMGVVRRGETGLPGPEPGPVRSVKTVPKPFLILNSFQDHPRSGLSPDPETSSG